MASSDGRAQRVLIDRFRHARRDRTLAVLEGFHPLKHALRFGAAIEVACAPDPARVVELARTLAPDLEIALGAALVRVPEASFAALAPAPPATGVIALAGRPQADITAILQGSGEAPVVLLEAPTHLGNLGAVVRVAAAAGAAAVLATGTHDPWHPAALRASAGLHFALPVAPIEHLPPPGRPLLALDPGGEPLGPGAIADGAILAFGAERRGLSPALLARAERRLAIPMRPGVSSLNLASAVAVALFWWRLSRAAD